MAPFEVKHHRQICCKIANLGQTQALAFGQILGQIQLLRGPPPSTFVRSGVQQHDLFGRGVVHSHCHIECRQDPSFSATHALHHFCLNLAQVGGKELNVLVGRRKASLQPILLLWQYAVNVVA